MSSTYRYAGYDSARQSAGLPGHCDDCAENGHVIAHPMLGCADVGCNTEHPVDLTEDLHYAAASGILGERRPGSDRIAAAQVHAILALCSAIRSLND